MEISLESKELGMCVRALRLQLFVMADHLAAVRQVNPSMALTLSNQLAEVRQLANKLQWGVTTRPMDGVCRICTRKEVAHDKSDNCPDFV